MNEITLSEMISKSLSGEITDSERQELSAKLEHSAPEAQSFASISTLIQRSISDVATNHDALEASSEGLSAIAKERLKKSVRRAKHDSMARHGADLGDTLGVAEPRVDYQNTSEAEPEDETRQAVSRFTLIRKIGEGGLGTVWLARDEKLRRSVALKEMRSAAAESPKLWKRFQREAEITGHLEHPNVVPLYMSGVNPETKMPFYAMRFLGKGTLADAIRKYHVLRPTSEDAALKLHRLLTAFVDVCQAIAYAHSRGVIHRDLKPENIALDNFGQVLVLDWGLARLDEDGELASRLALSGGPGDSSLAQTIAGDIVGTPLYMSPEQAAGEMDSLDERTDIYGLGAILFAILTGSAPHEKGNQSVGGNLKVTDFLSSIATSESPMPRELNPSLPHDLEAICLKAMSKERLARHESANELAADVEAWIAGKHRRQAKYDAMYMSGRDLKSRMCVQFRQLTATTQFMVELPPIQGLVSSVDQDADEYQTWRERLSKILLALAKTRTNISALSFSQISNDRINELVRVERSLFDVSNVHALPQSRLRRGAASTFHKTVLQQFPGESCYDLDLSTAGQVRLVIGVPVFDADSEEPFGLVVAESEIGILVRPELAMVGTKDNVFLIDDRDRILFSSKLLPNPSETFAGDVLPRWSDIKDSAANAEFTDPDREYYTDRLVFPQKNNSIHIVFQVAD